MAAIGLMLGQTSQGAVILLSSTLSHGTGSDVWIRDGAHTISPTTFSDKPFPNDAVNSVAIDPTAGALHVTARLDGRASFVNTTPGFVYSNDWTIEKFDVTFEVPEPSTFTFNYVISASYSTVHLLKDGVDYLKQAMGTRTPQSGILQPGTYSLRSQAGWEPTGPMPNGTLRYDVHDVAFDVTPTPEPAAMGVLGCAAATAALRRGRRAR